MNNQKQSFEQILNEIVKTKAPKTQVRSKFKSVRGRDLITDEIIDDCVSLSFALTLKWAREYETDSDNIDKTPPKKAHIQNYFFRALWTTISEEYNAAKDHTCVIYEFSDKIYHEAEYQDVAEHMIKTEMVDFVKQELLNVENHDINKKDNVFLNKMKKTNSEIIKNFAKETQEMIEKGFDCKKRLIYVRSFFSSDPSIVESAKICIEEIMDGEKVTSLGHYSACKNYSKIYLEEKTLQGLAEKMVDEGKSMSDVSREKNVLFEPLRIKIAGVRAKVQLRKAA